MIADLSDSILTPATILWIIAVVIATTLLFGSINRRRGRLTDTLKNYVDRNAIEKLPPTGGSENQPNGDDD